MPRSTSGVKGVYHLLSWSGGVRPYVRAREYKSDTADEQFLMLGLVLARRAASVLHSSLSLRGVRCGTGQCGELSRVATI